MPSREELLARAKLVVSKYDEWILSQPNVTAVGVGHKIKGHRDTMEPCVKIFVRKKIPRMPRNAQLPRFIDVGGGQRVPTDIVEGGPFFLQKKSGLESKCGSDKTPNKQRIRPARPGTSIGDVTVPYGTFGAVVIDDLSGKSLILSNNHVLYYEFDPDIFQPGVSDQQDDEDDSDDLVAELFNHVDPDLGVDAAVACPLRPEMILNKPLNGVPAPSPSCRAIGLLFGGDESKTTLLNPIDTVLSLLKVHFPLPDSTATSFVGMRVQKTGRTTQRTEGTVTCIHVSVPLQDVTFREQIATTCMSLDGDSGSLVVENL
jgi:hypothetical protein